MQYTKPNRLRKGDLVAIVSPSWGGPSCFPQVYDAGIKVLTDELGLRIKEYPSARAQADYLHDNPQFRAQDINQAFANPKVKAIFASIGGDDSVRILPYLDSKVISSNPKIVMGYSDTTTLLTYFNQLGLVTLHGPAIMSGFAQWKSLPRSFQTHVTQFLFQPTPTYSYQPYQKYSEGYLDWSDKKNAQKTKEPMNSPAWKLVQGNGLVQGELFGGCIEVLEFMKGTSYWPRSSFWKNKILFLETSEDKPTPDQVKWMLRNYGMQGIFGKINGVLMGRARDYSTSDNEELERILRQIIGNEFKRPDLPVVMNIDFGHTDPQIILPLGIKAEIDCSGPSLRLVENHLN